MNYVLSSKGRIFIIIFGLLMLIAFFSPIPIRAEENQENTTGDVADTPAATTPTTQDSDSTPSEEIPSDQGLSTQNSEDAALSTAAVYSISYRTHVQEVGWQNWVSDGATSGTSGKALRLEAIEIKTGISGLSVDYRTHVQDIGWQNWVSNGQTAGTSGKALRLEAIEIKLSGDQAANYDVYYRVHIEDAGWLNWAKNGESAGSQGFSARLEAIEIQIISKDTAFSGTGSGNSFLKPTISYQPHIQNLGWTNYAYDGATAGTTGKALQMEALKIDTSEAGSFLGLSYSAHVKNIGWQDFVNTNEISGTTGKNLQMEAIKIKLTGTASNKFDVYYRVHVKNKGWMGWAKNGESAGTEGYNYRTEAIEIKLVSKGGAAPGSTENAFSKKENSSNGIITTPTQTKVVEKDAMGIDVSYWNGGSIDWNAAKKNDVKFAILRTGYGWSGDGSQDSTFAVNYKNTKAAGIPVGVYHYSYAMSVAEAKKEAEYCLSILNKRDLDLPVVFDVEDENYTGKLSKSEITNIIITFCDTIKAGGYEPMVYANLNWLNNKINFNSIKNYKIWLAQYNTTPDFTGHFELWQYSSSGTLDIGSKTTLDLNKAYADFYK